MEGRLGASVATIGRCFNGVIRWFVATSSPIATTPPSRVTPGKCRGLVYSVISALARGLIRLLGRLSVVLFML